jgi:hypothetical protein
MRRRQILLDEQSDRILQGVAKPYRGNKSLAVREVLKTHSTLEKLLSEIERSHAASLRRQKARSEGGFRDGKFTPWEEVKRRNHL